jgi:predicted metal-dependent peptidase
MKKKSKNTETKKDIELVIVMDRSGSMCAIQSDMEGAINTYIKDQQKNFPHTKLTFVQFDTEYEVLHKAVKITKVVDITLKPRGCTALFDAIGRTINETHTRLKEGKTLPQLLFVIVTDGMENSSTEFKRDTILKMIEGQKKNNWDFIFLGANQDAIQEGSSIGIDAGKCLEYKTSGGAIRGMSSSLCCYTSSMRASSDTSKVGFTQKDRQDQENS